MRASLWYSKGNETLDVPTVGLTVDSYCFQRRSRPMFVL